MKRITFFALSLIIILSAVLATFFACDKDDKIELTAEQLKWQSDFEIILSNIDKLEALALDFSSENGGDVRKLLSGYLRIGRYDDTFWNILAGTPNASFTEYVNTSPHSEDIASLLELDLVKTPFTGAENDFIHTFGTYSMILTGYGDLGGWAGDIATLAEDLLSETGNVEELTAAGKQKYFNIYGGFDAPDVVSDMDAVVFYNEWIPKINRLSDVMRTYYNEKITSEKDRVTLYAFYDNIDLTLSNQELRDYIYNRVMKAKGVQIFWANDGFDTNTNQDRIIAACNCYADYLFENKKL